jgi:hypothetical protein
MYSSASVQFGSVTQTGTARENSRRTNRFERQHHHPPASLVYNAVALEMAKRAARPGPGEARPKTGPGLLNQRA